MLVMLARSIFHVWSCEAGPASANRQFHNFAFAALSALCVVAVLIVFISSSNSSLDGPSLCQMTLFANTLDSTLASVSLRIPFCLVIT